MSLFVGNSTVNSVIGSTTASIGANSTTTAISVAANGNVGIGNTAPVNKLSVNGTTYLQANVTLNAALVANGGAGSAGQVLHSNGTATYWAADDQGVTSVATGNGLTGGTITTTGTVSVLANTGIVANATGLYVNATYINTISSNSATYANASITNTFTVGTGTYFVSNGNVGIGTSAPAYRLDVNGETRILNNLFGIGSLEINKFGSGNRYAYVDLVGDDTYSDYGLRLIRNNTGSNTFSVLYHRGTGDLSLITQEAAPITFYTTNSERVRIDASGNVGIGTSSPGTKLDVVGSIRANGSLTIGTGGTYQAGSIYSDGNWGILFRAAGNTVPVMAQFAWYGYDQAEYMRISPSGNVGIGTTSPAQKLDVSGGAIKTTNGGKTVYINPYFASIAPAVQVASADPLLFVTNNTERMRIDASGNVGIGTTSPATTLTISNPSSPSSTYIPLLVKGGSGGTVNDGGGIAFSASVSSVITSPSQAASAIRSLNEWSGELAGEQGSLAFYTNKRTAANTYTGLTEKMRITADGNVGVGVTPIYKFEVKTGNDALLRVIDNGATQTSQIQSTNLARNAYAPLSIGGSYTVIETSGTEKVRVDASGNVGIGTTSPSTKLTVNGSIYAINTADLTPNATWSGHLSIGANGYTGGISFDATGMWVGHNSSGRSLIFATDETSRMTIAGASGLVSVANGISVTGSASLTGGYVVSAQPAHFIGTANTQQILNNYGWSNGISRWRPVIESDASFSFYSYDTTGSFITQCYSINNSTGLFSIKNSLSVTGSASLTGGYVVNVQPAHYIGSAGTQQILNNYGWNNSVGRWKPVLEADANFSFYSYDSAGGSASARLTINNSTGVVTIPASLSVSGTTTSQITGGNTAGSVSGVRGFSNNAQGVEGTSTSNYGVTGKSGSASYAGVIGYASNTSIFGTLGQGGVNSFYGVGTLYNTGAATITGNLSFNSGYGSAAVAYGCRAWVNFNGTGTVAIRGSGNVTSITDNGVGDYTMNFTTAMPDVNYNAVGTVGDTTQGFASIINVGSRSNLWTQAAGSLRFQVGLTSNAYDGTNVNISIFR